MTRKNSFYFLFVNVAYRLAFTELYIKKTYFSQEIFLLKISCFIKCLSESSIEKYLMVDCYFLFSTKIVISIPLRLPNSQGYLCFTEFGSPS